MVGKPYTRSKPSLQAYNRAEGFSILELLVALAVTGAVASLVGLALFWNAFPVLFPNKIGALAVDVAVLVGVLLVDWPTEEMLTR